MSKRRRTKIPPPKINGVEPGRYKIIADAVMDLRRAHQPVSLATLNAWLDGRGIGLATDTELAAVVGPIDVARRDSILAAG